MPRPDVNDITIMKAVRERSTIPEMSERTGLGFATVHKRLQDLQDMNFVNPPRKPHAARDYTLTENGEDYLTASGFIPMEVFSP